MKVIWLRVCLDSEPEAHGVGMRWGGGCGSVHQAGNWSGGPDGAIRLPTSVQTILYPELSAWSPWVREPMDRLES